MAVVGFQVIESAVDESVGNKFTCIEIISGGPLMFDSVIRFFTVDDTAVGKKTTRYRLPYECHGHNTLLRW